MIYKVTRSLEWVAPKGEGPSGRDRICIVRRTFLFGMEISEVNEKFIDYDETLGRFVAI